MAARHMVANQEDAIGIAKNPDFDIYSETPT